MALNTSAGCPKAKLYESGIFVSLDDESLQLVYEPDLEVLNAQQIVLRRSSPITFWEVSD
jgi:hypothetical protein